MAQHPEFFPVIGRKKDVVEVQLREFPVDGPVKDQGRGAPLLLKPFHWERYIFQQVPVEVKNIDIADHHIRGVDPPLHHHSLCDPPVDHHLFHRLVEMKDHPQLIGQVLKARGQGVHSLLGEIGAQVMLQVGNHI